MEQTDFLFEPDFLEALYRAAWVDRYLGTKDGLWDHHNPLVCATAGQVIFSGIQPTGVPHLGNYLGALKHWVRLQNEESPKGAKLFFSVVDLHAITVPQAASRLRQWKREALASLLAVGLDPQRSTIFFQSSVAAHSELMWILSCTASVGYLSRMTQWKSKLNDMKARAALSDSPGPDKPAPKLGLFSYPVLQAADILVHRATHVPVGEDQSQHLEFARECVTNFNSTYGECLVAPQTLLSKEKRIMSLRRPTVKMSKSDPDASSRISITDDDDTIVRKVSSALTDSQNTVSYDPLNRPGVANLLSILSAFDKDGRDPAVLADTMAGSKLQDLKRAVSDAVISGLGGIRERYLELLDADGGKYLDHVASNAARRARQSASDTMELVRERVGL